MGDVRVLLVDDHEPFRNAAAAVVGATDGFVIVASAVDGHESLAAVEAHRPDLVLMDVNLPGIDGLEATRRICSSNGAPAVVLLSTYDIADLGEDASRCGAGAYVAKSDFDSACLRDVWDLVRG